MGQRYDTIGKGYAAQRVGDPRWEAQIHAALGDAASVLNIGAGTGNYEPSDRTVVAVEPSETMLAQRTTGVAVRGVAEQLPFPDHTFDAAMGVLTVHHWSSQADGLRELRRVAERQVLTVYEQLVTFDMWLVDYFPEIRDLQVEQNAPTPATVAEYLDVVDVQTMWVPHDMTDGVGAAYWRRPEKYLARDVQQGMSMLALLPTEFRERGTEQLRDDLADGTWADRYGDVLASDRFDAGYRLVIAENR